MSQNYFLVKLSSVLLVMTILTNAIPTPDAKKSPSPSSNVESSTVKILIPSPDPSFDDGDDDAVIIEANPNAPPVDSTPDTFHAGECLLPKVKGPCRAIIDSWYYNAGSSSCELFQWSGCGGNNNRFSEKAFCQLHCSAEKLKNAGKPTHQSQRKKNETSSDSKCPKFEGCGPLKCGVSKDPVTGCEKCECNFPGSTSTSGANGPNANSSTTGIILGSVSGNPEDPTQQSHVPPKATKQDKKTALLKPEEICKLPETRGNCRAMMTRWRYNPAIKDCVEFHFGGCDGNPNNFVSKDKCLELCKGQ